MKITLQFDSVEEFDAFIAKKKAEGVLRDTSALTPIRHALGDQFMSMRLLNSLQADGFQFVEDALYLTRNDLLRMPNLGRKLADDFDAWKKSRLENIPA